ncbi:SoxR reducing system RseC family protein [Silanimonas sp.]|uniref:SoxR reducing system RseC family protein n=1 Tax=Silanimonas sp. TaxID=1929290 RepID=UPI0022C89093|nr:SoxR reducing system RseC family protein [Silanimonas sp.]MCZ8166172.1 SoxR reducing system RseC family protein [Silanimonas sp.]
MTPASPSAGESIRRRAVVVSAEDRRLALRWTESQCRGCVGCGGRCGLFAADDAGVVRLEHDATALQPGDAVDVEVSAPRLRHAAMRAYGLALVALIAGAVIGHAVGARWGAANAGALVGLLLGTFLAGVLTKRLDASPPLRVRPCPECPSELESDPKELPR